jgi:hypothetical protein
LTPKGPPSSTRKLVNALHTGTSVTLTSEGKTATFTPTGQLGYGEAYIAMALAAEALRNAGVTGCATPEQWQAVLLGGPLSAAGARSSSVSTTSSASASSNFPGILALRSQGQGWGRIAQTTNVQLGQVMSRAQSSLNLGTSGDSSLSPTGRSSAEMNQSRSTTGSSGLSTDSGPYGSSNQSESPGKAKGKGKGKGKGHGNSDTRTDNTTSPSSTSPGQSSSYPSSSTTPNR